MSETKVLLAESSVLQNFSLQCKNNSLDVTPDEGEWFVKALLGGVTEFLNIVKSKAAPKTVAISDLKGNMIASATIQYLEGDETEAAEGSWAYTWTFNPDDLPKNEDGSLKGDKYQITDNQVIEVITRVGYDLARMAFTSSTFVSQMGCYFFKIVADTLDQNAPTVEDAEWAVEMPGYFTASVSIEDGKKVFAFEPSAELKVKMKDDSVSEK